MTVAVLPGVLAAVAGAGAGWGIRLLLARLRRGAVLRPGVPELATALLVGVGVAASWPGPMTILVVWAALLAVALGAVDLKHHRLPDALTLPAVPISAVLAGVTALTYPGSGSLLTAATLAAVATVAFWLLARVAPRAMGLGDVKLVPSLALLTGYPSAASWVLGLLLAFVLGALVSVLGLLTRRLRLSSAIPFGPFLLAGAWLVLTFPGMVSLVTG